MKIPKEKITKNAYGTFVKTTLFLPYPLSDDYEKFMGSKHYGCDVVQGAYRYFLIEMLRKRLPENIKIYYLSIAKELWPDAKEFHQFLKKLSGKRK